MLSKLGRRILWFYKPTPPKRSPFTPNPKEFLLIIVAVVIGVAFQIFAPVIFAKVKRTWKMLLNFLCNDSGHRFFDFHVSRKIATDSYNNKISDFNYEKGSEDNDMIENSQKMKRKLRSRKSVTKVK